MVDSLPIISPIVMESLLKLYNTNEQQLLHVLSTSPSHSVVRINTNHPSHGNAEQNLQNYLDSLPTKQIAYKVTKHQLLPDVLIVSTNDSECKDLTRAEKEVIVDTNCGSAVLRGADIFAPGVLAAHPCMQRGDVVSVYVDLEGECRRGLAKKFEGKKYFVGNGVALYSRGELFVNNAKLKGTGIQMVSCRTPHPSFAQLDVALFFPQNLPSTVVGHVLDPCVGEVVLDMCASPGGKTTHIAALMQNKGVLIALDKTQNKVDRIKDNCSSLGLGNVHTFAFDSTKSLREDAVETQVASLKMPQPPPFPAQSFDKILLDPPCSGLGQRPQLRYVTSAKELSSFPALQKKLIKQAVALLKPGGTLVYSTCTLLPEENETQVAWILENYPQMKLSDQTPVIGRRGLGGCGLDDADCNKVQRYDWCFLPPSHPALQNDGVNAADAAFRDTIGFFIAKFVKT